MIHRRSGFTLIEMMLAITIAIIIIFMAMPSIRGLSAEKRLQETFEKFDALARKAQVNAVAEQRAWTLVWGPGTITLEPDEPTPEERQNAMTEDGNSVTEVLAVGKEENYSLDRPVALLPLKDQKPEWTFWRSGTCEPVIVTYSGPAGTWTAQYHPLTGHGEITDQRLP
jgi:prepilin-type N-terminal cleavage/methylation domain-containing protein